MAQFNVLQYNQSFMAKIGIHSYRIAEPTNEFLQSPIAFFIPFVLIVCHVISSAVFISQNSQQFEAVLQAIFLMIAGIQSLGMYFSVGLKMKEVKILQLKLQQIVDEGETLKCHVTRLLRHESELKRQKRLQMAHYYSLQPQIGTKLFANSKSSLHCPILH